MDKKKLAKLLEGMPENEALDFLDKYKDSIKYKNAHKKRESAPIKNVVNNTMKDILKGMK